MADLTDLNRGVFPLGPQPQDAEVARLRKIIESLVTGMLMIRRATCKMTDPKDYDFWRMLVNPDHRCIICGEDRKDGSGDLDTLFCSNHCPVCDDWSAVLDG